MAKKTGVSGVSWDRIDLAPIVAVRGKESLLADRALTRLRELARAEDPQVEITRVEAPHYSAGELATYTSPSLFGERRLIEIRQVESASEALVSDLLAYLRQPQPDAWVIICHAGGQRAKKLLDALTKAKIPTVACNELTYPRDKIAFVNADVRRARRRIDPDAAQALVDAQGSSLAELAATLSQLLSDTTGTLTRADVDRYLGGRIEATGFAVADAAVAGHVSEALTLARHALMAGAPAQFIISALAMKLRTLAKVSQGGRSAGIDGWRAKKAREQLRGWNEAGLAAAIIAVAAADEESKGGGRDREFAVERAVRRVAQARHQR
ncbi:MAG: DNA polymerase III subunit delta [Actinomycetaceae bacterium]|nr:DNA polymerase III subunit delta [Actinomycetaceae bacterium]